MSARCMFRPMKVTKIKVGDEQWEVPRGFGAAYRRTAEEPAPPEVLRDILELVGWTAKPEQIAGWSLRKRRVEVQVYAERIKKLQATRS